MSKRSLAIRSLTALLLGLPLSAQQAGAPPAAAAPASKGDALRRAMVETEAGRTVISTAAEEVLNGGTAARVRFTALVRSITAAAPKPEPKPEAKAEPKTDAPAPKDGAPAPAEPAKVELPEATKALMNEVVTGNDEASKAALTKLAADAETGKLALARLEERGRIVFQRCLFLTVRRKIDTNAVFAGQYDELKDFQPEAGELLLAWAALPPKEVQRDAQRAEPFRTASLRAVRDIVPADQATDATRAALRQVLGKAQHAQNQQLLIAAACALHQYGDASAFDKIKGEVEKAAATAKDDQLIGVTNTLAELHYQLRDYETAATHFKTVVAMLEKSPNASGEGMGTMIYNAACSLALAKKTDEALQFLDKALQVGAKSGNALKKTMIDADHDMNNLRADPRFAELMERHFGKGAGAPK